MSAMIVARTIAVCSLLVTAILVYSSNFIDGLPATKKWIPAVFFLVCILPVLLESQSLNLKRKMNAILYGVIKSAGSFACFYGFNWLGSSFEIKEDKLLINASLGFLFYLLSIDFLFDVDEDIAICDGYLFSGYGVLLRQEKIPEWVVVCTCITVCLIKNGLKRYKESFDGANQEGQKVKGSILIAARTVAVCSHLVTTILVYTSKFIDRLPVNRKWIPGVFFLVSFLPVLVTSQSLNLKRRMNAILYTLIKSAGSFGCYYAYNWLGSSFEIQKDLLLINASLAFAIYLIGLDFLFQIDEDFEVSDGYVFSGYQVMLGQKEIPRWIVIVTGVSLSFLKNLEQLYRQKKNGEVEMVRVDREGGGDTGELEMVRVDGEGGRGEATPDVVIQVPSSELLQTVSFRRNRGV